MDERDTVFGNEQERIESTLSYIVGSELLKPMDEMDTALIEKSIRAIQQIDKRAVPTDKKVETAIESILSCSKEGTFDEKRIPDPFITDKKGYARKKLSNKIKIIIIAAIISALIAGIAVYAFTDIFSLFFNDPRDKLEWEDGESHQIGNYEMIISSEVQQFDSIEELKSEIDVPIVCPENNPERQIINIFYSNLENCPAVIIDYTYSINVKINYSIFINSDNPTQEELNSCNYEKIETENNNAFFIMKNTVGYQALARIDNNVYIISSGNKDDIIHFIKNVKEL